MTNDTYNIAADELRSFVERIEQLESEKADIADSIKEVYAESKGRGYDTGIMKKIIAMGKKDRDALAEEEAILDMYRSALGRAIGHSFIHGLVPEPCR